MIPTPDKNQPIVKNGDTPELEFVVFYPKPADFAPEPVFPPGHRWAGSKRCLAWSSRNNRQCSQRAMIGKTKCQSHGGKTPSGMASPHFKDGRHIRSLPTRLISNYQASLQDKDLLSLRYEIALIDTRTQELLGQIDAQESGRLWQVLKDNMSKFDSIQRRAASLPDGEARKTELAREMSEVLSTIRQSIHHGAADWMIWQEISESLEMRRRLVESEQKRLVAMQVMVTSEQAMILVSALTAAVRKHVTDTKQLSSIQNEFIRLVGSGNSESANT
jgi:hypothetical protein